MYSNSKPNKKKCDLPNNLCAHPVEFFYEFRKKLHQSSDFQVEIIDFYSTTMIKKLKFEYQYNNIYATKVIKLIRKYWINLNSTNIKKKL